MQYTITRAQLANVAANLDLDLEEGNIRTDYSGRAMYGRSCLGIVIDGNMVAEEHTVIMELAIEMSEAGENQDGYEAVGSIRDFMYDLQVRRDSMGRSEIVYFPQISVEAEGDDSDDEFDYKAADAEMGRGL